MKNPNEHTSISVPRRLKKRLKQRKATGQSYAGLIEELLDAEQ